MKARSNLIWISTFYGGELAHSLEADTPGWTEQLDDIPYILL